MLLVLSCAPLASPPLKILGLGQEVLLLGVPFKSGEGISSSRWWW